MQFWYEIFSKVNVSLVLITLGALPALKVGSSVVFCQRNADLAATLSRNMQSMSTLLRTSFMFERGDSKYLPHLWPASFTNRHRGHLHPKIAFWWS